MNNKEIESKQETLVKKTLDRNQEIGFLPLGGQDEKGKNLYALIVEDKIFLFDMGFKFPLKDMLGIDVIFPNISFLTKNKEKIKALFISKATNNFLGATSYFLRKINVPIYCSSVVKNILLNRFQIFKNVYADGEQKGERKHKIIALHNRESVTFGGVKIETFSTQTSFPGSFGYVVYTKLGVVVYTGEYIFSGNDENSAGTDINHLTKVVEKNNCLLLVSNTFEVNQKTFSSPFYKITSFIENAFRMAKGKIYFVCYEENWNYINEMFLLAHNNGFKVFLSNKNSNCFPLMKEVNFSFWSKFRSSLVYQLHPDLKKIVVVITGNNKNLLSNVTAFFKHNTQEVSVDDYVINATSPENGYELVHAQVIDQLSDVSDKFININNHQFLKQNVSLEDLLLMVKILKPKFFLPVSSLYKNFMIASDALKRNSFNEKNIIFLENGDFLLFSSDGSYGVKKKFAAAEEICVNGVVVDKRENIFKERQNLMLRGILIISLNLDRKNISKVIDENIKFYGIMTNDKQKFTETIKAEITTFLAVEKQNLPSTNKVESLKLNLKKKFHLFFSENYGKKPTIIVTIFLT